MFYFFEYFSLFVFYLRVFTKLTLILILKRGRFLTAIPTVVTAQQAM